MAVSVELGPADMGPVEVCMLCHHFTNYWWAGGCAPLCRKCASVTTHEDMYSLAERHNLGPLPKQTTEL